MSPEDIFSPMSWPTWLRRTFLLALPIAGPLWLVICGLGFVLFITMFCCMYIALLFGSVWTGRDLFD